MVMPTIIVVKIVIFNKTQHDGTRLWVLIKSSRTCLPKLNYANASYSKPLAQAGSIRDLHVLVKPIVVSTFGDFISWESLRSVRYRVQKMSGSGPGMTGATCISIGSSRTSQKSSRTWSGISTLWLSPSLYQHSTFNLYPRRLKEPELHRHASRS